MAIGSGGFYAAQAAFKQAAQTANGRRAPSDFSSALVCFYAFAMMVALLGVEMFVVSALFVFVLLYGITRGSLVTLLPRYRRRMQMGIGVAYGTTVATIYCLTRLALATDPSIDLNNAHSFSAGLALALGYVAYTITRRLLWKRYAPLSLF